MILIKWTAQNKLNLVFLTYVIEIHTMDLIWNNIDTNIYNEHLQHVAHLVRTSLSTDLLCNCACLGMESMPNQTSSVDMW